MAKRAYWLLNLIVLLSVCAAYGSESVCVQVIYVKTGDMNWAGTDANVSLTIHDSQGNKVIILNLAKQGGMGKGYDYFEKGNLDMFAQRSKCVLKSAPCKIELSHDNSGEFPGWYVDYVNVILASPGPECSKQKFSIDQWLADDEKPYSLSVTKDQCVDSPGDEDHHVHEKILELLTSA